MAESLGTKQKRFTLLIAKLIIWSYENGYELTVGDAFRSPKVFGEIGIKKEYSAANSNHKRRLAQDFNLFKDGKYLMTTEDYKPLGEFWLSLADDCAWGGEGNRKDGNHFSLMWKSQW